MLIFVLGIVIGTIRMHTADDAIIPPHPFHIWRPALYVPRGSVWVNQALGAALAQLPLTTLNSIVAVTHLSADLMPSRPAPSESHLGISVAAINLVGCWFGAMPTCHGSGGLAGQFRFGARSGSSVILLGLIKVFLGLFVGEGLLGLLRVFPKSLLGVMVVAAGIELAKVGESLNSGARDLWEDAEVDAEGHSTARKPRELSDHEKRERWSTMLVTIAGILAFRNDAVGFIAGMLWHWGLTAPEKWVGWRARQEEARWDSADEETQTLLQSHDRPEGRMV
ncbi:hypothetical protein LTS18_014413 [Coniosporium uncinatum]|uniref:Uncharacterized protein n=1 Tax=Coniosporium uncinatum TaxID=93489 RepID=A0ACC3CVJ0_9PEZI|nr:hypothetical protein LTS18_014413 [Coniosporium uncinatum]